MTVSMNVTSLWAGGTVTPTAPLIEGTVAPSLFLSRESGSGFDLNPAPAAGRYGCRITFPSALDFSSDYVGFGAGFQIYDTATNVATVASGGFRIVWIDGSGNYAGFNINGGSIPGYSSGNGEGYIQSFIARDGDLAAVWAIHKNRTPDISSGSISWSNITSVEISVLTTSAVRRDMYLRCVVRKNPILVTGTETFTTINTTAWAQGATVIDRQHFARLRRYLNGPVQSVFTSKLGLSIGDGSTTTNFTESNFSLGFTNTFDKSPAYTTTGPFVQLDNSNTRQILINQSASCVLSLSDGTIGSAAWWQWVLQGSGTATLARVQFWRYSQFLAAHGIYTDCIWDGGEAAVAVVAATTITRGTVRNATAGGAVITGAPGNYATSLDATFANNATYDIAMGSGGAGTYNLASVKVNSGYTLKLHNNSAINAIVVQIAAGITASTTTAGGSITISAPAVYQSVVVTGFTAGSRIHIYDTTSLVELFNGTVSGSDANGSTVVSGSIATWTDVNPAVAVRAIRVRISYVSGAVADTFKELTGLTCLVAGSRAGITYPLTPEADSTYNTNGLNGPSIYPTSGITFTDAATDLVNCDIAGGSVTWPTIYACFVYWSFTSAGIANDFTYIAAPDTANYLLSAMKLRNTSAVDLMVIGGYGRDATSGLSKDIIDTAGSTGNIFLAPDHVVPYQTTGTYAITGDISTVLSAIPSAAATADAVRTELGTELARVDVAVSTRLATAGYTAPANADIAAVKAKTDALTFTSPGQVDANLMRVLSEPFDGDGSDDNPWGPV